MRQAKSSSLAKPNVVQITPEDVLPLFGELFTRQSVRALLSLPPGKRLYWRLLTPLVVLWGFVYQRLSADHSCDGYTSHLRSGAVDGLDAETDAAHVPSVGLHSESTSAYVQGRNRLPLVLLQNAYRRVAQQAQAEAGETGRWHGHPVRLLDGVCFRARPVGDIYTTYPPTTNGQGESYWCQVRSLIACDWFSQTAVAMAETCFQSSETDLVADVVSQETAANALYVADRGLGIYRTVQVLAAYGQHGLLRLRQDRAQALWQRNKQPALNTSGDSCLVTWSPSRHDQPFALPTAAVTGRLIYWHLVQDGFRPIDLYFFTTLTDDEAYPIVELVQLYAQRWLVEVHFRHIKATLEMADLEAHSAAMLRKELAAGLLAYNLVMLLITKAALTAGLRPQMLSFSQCFRRIFDAFTTGVPASVAQTQSIATWLLQRLAKCRLPKQPHKVKHEPRKMRYKPRGYPHLSGSRNDARLANIAALNS